jgi:chondroitin sulfate N-acetylgalactosaminyltransferase 1/2
MTKLTTVILPHDRRIFLTVVYFGDDGLQRARNIITKASRDASFRMVKLLTLNETFSRGKALQVTQVWQSRNDPISVVVDSL